MTRQLWSAAARRITVTSSEYLELRNAVAEACDFRRADEGPIQWIEEQDHVLPLVVAQRHFLYFAVDDSTRLERGRWLPNYGGHLGLPVNA